MAEWNTAGKVRMTPKGTYSSSVAYDILDIVSNSEGTISYIAKQTVPAGTSLDNVSYWAKLSDVSPIVYSIANAYDPERTYNQGELVMHDGQLYRFKTSHTGEWSDSTSVVEATTAATSIQRSLNNLANDWESEHTYEAGEYVIYLNRLYKFTSQNNGSFVYLCDQVKRLEQEGNLANYFDPSYGGDSRYAGYSQGDLVMYNEQLYRFTSRHASGQAWSGSDVEGTTMATVAHRIQASLAPTYNTSDTYEFGDYVLYLNRLYKFADGNIGNPIYLCDQVNRLEKGYNLANQFNPSQSNGYYKKDMVMYHGQLYQFTADHSGAWTGSDVIPITLATAIKNLHVSDYNLANPFNPNYTGDSRYAGYSQGDLVMYEDNLYRFNKRHTGAWSFEDVENESPTTLATSVIRGLESIAAAYVPGQYYPYGKYVMNMNRLYRFSSNNNAEPVHLCDIVESLEIGGNLAEQFNPSAINGYSVGDLVMYHGNLYRFTSNHTGAWNAADVEVTTLADDIARISITYNNGGIIVTI